MTLYDLPIRNDVWDKKLDANLAPELSDVALGKAHPIYNDPNQFFSVTYFSSSMNYLINEIIDTFKHNKGDTIIITSLFGGGKTHSLIALYHAFSSPNVAKKYGFDIPSDVKVIVIGGKDANTAPSPDNPVNGVKTLWGYIAYKLGKYDLMKQRDEDLITPTKDELEKLFKGEKVLILVDEIAWYLERLSKSVYGSYYNQCLLFFEALAGVTQNVPVVLVITLPANLTSQGIKGEVGYDETVIEALWKRVERIGKPSQSPISTDIDLAQMLKKRIFGDVQISLKLFEEYRSKAQTFKDLIDVSVINDLDKTYPFHPLYIKVLQRLLELHNGLEKTRDALRITRIAVRQLYNQKPTRDLVLPSDIDIKNSEIENLLLRNYGEFKNVVTEIRNKTKGLEINYLIANYIFLSTFVFRLGLKPDQYKANLPDNKEIVTSVFDLSYLSKLNFTPSDVVKQLNEITQGISMIPYLVSYEGKYWFTFLTDPRTLCVSEARSISDIEVLGKFEEFIDELAYNKRGSYIVLNESSYRIVPSINSLISDDEPKYEVVIIRDPVPADDLEDRLKTFIFKKELKSPRNYANTIALTYSTDSNLRSDLTSRIKEYLGCKKVDVNNYYSDDIMRKVASNLMKNYINELEKHINVNLISYFSNLAFPVDLNQIRIEPLAREDITLLERVESTLKSANKLLDKSDLNFDLLSYYLSQVSVDITSQRWKFSDIMEKFYSNPKLPWISKDSLKEAILEGLRNSKIGIWNGNEVYFKRLPNQDFSIEIINDNSTILPPLEAAQLQIEELIKRTTYKEEGDIVIKKYYVLKLDDGEMSLDNLMSQQDWFYKYLNGTLELKEERVERGVDIEVNPSFISEYKGKTVKINISLKKIGSFEGNVELTIIDKNGNVIYSSPNFKPDSSYQLDYEVKDNDEIRCIVRYNGKEKTRTIPVTVKTIPDLIEIPPGDIPEKGKIEKINYSITTEQDVEDLTRSLRNIIGEKRLNGNITLDNGKNVTVTISIKDVDMDTLSKLVHNEITIIGRTNAKINGNVEVNIITDKILDSNEKDIIRQLANKGKAKVYVRVKNE